MMTFFQLINWSWILFNKNGKKKTTTIFWISSILHRSSESFQSKNDSYITHSNSHYYKIRQTILMEKCLRVHFHKKLFIKDNTLWIMQDNLFLQLSMFSVKGRAQ
ncbi:hypothetical protein EGR_04986 [Echinococcus granulosus]|uniref:Uncharacterized protein n=1 Tax=Echinococcus granulosus TaxID=6210 RepID=W6UGP1_ECHGR|nr:hypothetical protein EGR_04986 [Echinococcus granulosus]EUB60133.1 hypothetical protein EGR_04986 [Echinococcus granulosus]